MDNYLFLAHKASQCVLLEKAAICRLVCAQVVAKWKLSNRLTCSRWPCKLVALPCRALVYFYVTSKLDAVW